MSLMGVNSSLTRVLAVRTLADLPAYDDQIPEPLEPEPPAMRIAPPIRALRNAAGEQWAAWWRITWTQNVAAHREATVQPEPPLFGLDPIYEADPPDFPSLSATPELRDIVATSWPVLSTWTKEVSTLDVWAGARWPRDLVARAGVLAGRPIADVDVRLEVLPVAGLRHWELTADADRHLLHALVTPELARERTRFDAWLLDALRRIG